LGEFTYKILTQTLTKGSWNDKTIKGILLGLGRLKEKLNKYDIYELKMLQIHASSYFKNNQVTWAQSAIIGFIFGLLAYIATNIIPALMSNNNFDLKLIIYIGIFLGIFLGLRRVILRDERCRFASILLSELIQLCINEKTNTSNSNTK